MPPLTTRAIQPHRVLGQNYRAAQFFQKYGPCVTVSHCESLPLYSLGLRHPPTLQASPSLHAVLSMSMRNLTTTTRRPPRTPAVPSPNTCQTWPPGFAVADIKKLIGPRLKKGAKPDYEWLAKTFAMGEDADKDYVNTQLEKLVVPQQASIRIIKDKCMLLLRRFPMAVSKENIKILVDRSLKVFETDEYIKVYEGINKVCAPSPKVVSIIAGESGGGKTVEAIASVCSNSDIHKDRYLRFYCLASNILDKKSTLGRDDQCVAGLKSAMRNCRDNKGRDYDFLAEIIAATKDGTECTLGIVVDEAGSYPQVVRALCRIGSELGGKLGLAKTVTVQVVVAGTGVGSSDLPPGSLPETYRVTVLPTNEKYWKSISEDVQKEVIKCIDSHERAPLMVRNPRFARLLLSAIGKVSTSTVVIFSDKTARDFVNLWLAQAASEFKSLNGLNSVKPNDVLGVLGSALRIALLGNTPPPRIHGTSKAKHDPAAERFSTFITKYGMVVDTAKWVKKKDYKPFHQDIWATEPKSGHLLVADKGQRFTLSLAHSSILMLLLELVPRRSSLTGESLESCTATLFPVLISAFRSREVGEMFRALQIECNIVNLIPDNMVVWSKQYHTQGRGVLDAFKSTKRKSKAFKKTDAYVITNGPKYPFADIVVLIPKTAMILIQCKDYSSGLHVGVIKEELTKMCHPSYPPNYDSRPTQKRGKAMKKEEKRNAIKKQEEDKVKEKKKAAAIGALKRRFGITEVVYAFVGSDADVMKNARKAFVKDASKNLASHTVCFGGLSGVTEEPLKSIIAFDDEKASNESTQRVGELTYETSISK